MSMINLWGPQGPGTNSIRPFPLGQTLRGPILCHLANRQRKEGKSCGTRQTLAICIQSLSSFRMRALSSRFPTRDYIDRTQGLPSTVATTGERSFNETHVRTVICCQVQFAFRGNYCGARKREKLLGTFSYLPPKSEEVVACCVFDVIAFAQRLFV